jgi:CHAT domain-containing protein
MGEPFRVRVIRTPAGGCEIHSSAGGEYGQCDVPTSLNRILDVVGPLQAEMNRTANGRRVPVAEADDEEISPYIARRESPISRPPSRSDLRITQDVGTELFKFLFQSEIKGHFRRSLERATQRNETLPVQLSIEHPLLSSVPWETLYDQDTRLFLALTRQTPLTRTVLPAQTPQLTRPKRLPLQILGMVARPANSPSLNLDPIDAEGEQVELKKAIQELESQGKIEVHWTLSGRQPDLEDAMTRSKNPWNVFHFIGHGGFDTEVGEGYLVIQEEDGTEPDLLYSDTLKGILVGPNGPQLVVLNSCKGAYSQSGDVFSSTAAALVLAGIPAAVAMQFVVGDDMAKKFTKYFYKYLAEGQSLADAVTMTRINLRPRFSEWAAPVLYLRSADGPLFEQGPA